MQIESSSAVTVAVRSNSIMLSSSGDYFVLKVTPMQFHRSICSQFLVVLVAALPFAAAAEPPTMKAIVLHKSGGPEVLKYEDAPRPQPKDDEVLIRVIAAGVNPVDVFIREGRTARFPFIPGMDVAGLVEQMGNKVTKFKRGDAVYAYLSFEEQGGYAEFA